jgi:hypothetical protein
MLILPTWDTAALVTAVEELCRGIERRTWTEVGLKLSRYMDWEFQDPAAAKRDRSDNSIDRGSPSSDKVLSLPESMHAGLWRGFILQGSQRDRIVPTNPVSRSFAAATFSGYHLMGCAVVREREIPRFDSG